jgi:transcriptional regulator with XRE-family HTH domain
VITMELLGKIRRMHVRDKMSVRAIAKRTGLSRNTLQKWLAAPEEVAAPKYIRAKGFSKLGAFTDELAQSLKADALRPKKDSCTSPETQPHAGLPSQKWSSRPTRSGLSAHRAN